MQNSNCEQTSQLTIRQKKKMESGLLHKSLKYLDIKTNGAEKPERVRSTFSPKGGASTVNLDTGRGSHPAWLKDKNVINKSEGAVTAFEQRFGSASFLDSLKN